MYWNLFCCGGGSWGHSTVILLKFWGLDFSSFSRSWIELLTFVNIMPFTSSILFNKPHSKQIHVIYYLEKIYDLESQSFIQSYNFNVTYFFKLRNFYCDLALLKRRPQNHKNKNLEEKLLVPPGQYITKM